jgi:putative glutamine amidotransferase
MQPARVAAADDAARRLTAEALPRVLVPACNRQLGEHPFHIAGKKYIDFVRLAGCLPLVVPNATPDELEALLAIADGVLLTGSPSNVHPRHFDEAVHDAALPLDEARDGWTLPFVPRLLALGVPVFAICRGTQEMNVALGGSLHQAIQEQPGLSDHRAAPDTPALTQYAAAHDVQVAPGGVLAGIVNRAKFRVNSVHGQGVKQLAQGLRAEAFAPDGLVEAFSMPDAPGFNLGVQWHPEWQAAQNGESVLLAGAFGQACRNYRLRRRDLLT